MAGRLHHPLGVLRRDQRAFDSNPKLTNLLLDPLLPGSQVEACQESWRRVCATALANGIPVPAFASALTYYDGYRNPRLPAENLLQAQRDYFGATPTRIDRPRGEFFHTDWTGKGGSTSASTYNV